MVIALSLETLFRAFAFWLFVQDGEATTLAKGESKATVIRRGELSNGERQVFHVESNGGVVDDKHSPVVVRRPVRKHSFEVGAAGLVQSLDASVANGTKATTTAPPVPNAGLNTTLNSTSDTNATAANGWTLANVSTDPATTVANANSGDVSATTTSAANISTKTSKNIPSAAPTSAAKISTNTSKNIPSKSMSQQQRKKLLIGAALVGGTLMIMMSACIVCLRRKSSATPRAPLPNSRFAVARVTSQVRGEYNYAMSSDAASLGESDFGMAPEPKPQPRNGTTQIFSDTDSSDFGMSPPTKGVPKIKFNKK